MTVACRIAGRFAGTLASCAFGLALVSGQQAHARDKALKGELDALVGRVVTTTILLGDRARPSHLAREGINLDFPVHTLVYAGTGEIRYRVEDLLWLERTDVSPSEMGPPFEAGSYFRISAIRIKDDRIEIKLKQLGGGSAEVKLMMEKGWQSRYDAESVQASLARVFAFEHSGQQPIEAEQSPHQAEPELSNSGKPEPATDFSMRRAHLKCESTEPLYHLHSTPNPESSVSAFRCGEKVLAGGEQNGWVKVRTKRNVEGYVSSDFVAYDEPLSLGESSANKPRGPDGQPNSEQPSQVSEASMQPAYIDCKALKQLELYPTPDSTSAPITVLRCGEKVTAIGEQSGWARVRTELNEVGFVSKYFLSYEPPSALGQSTPELPSSTEGQPDAPAAATAPSSDNNVQQSQPTTTEQRPPSSAPSAEPASREDGPWSWYYYILAGLLLLTILSAVGSTYRGRRKQEEKKDQEEKELREAHRKEQERKEHRRKNQELHERASARRQYAELVGLFADLLATCGPQADEIKRASLAIEGGNFEGITVTKVVVADILLILGVISRSKGQVPIGFGRLCQALYGSLNFEEGTSVERHNFNIDVARQGSRAASLPGMVTLLDLYDQAQGTRLAAKAAKAYWTLVRAACEIADSKRGVATELVQAKYLELLRPYLSGTDHSEDGSKQRARSDGVSDNNESSFARCPECPESYEVLGIAPSATKEEIKTAYRDLAKIFHSDHLQSSADRVQRKADDKLKDINKAYAHISSHWKT